MAEMTAAQATEWGKTLDFPQVWATITALGDKFDRMAAKTDEQIRQMSARTDEQIRQMSTKVDSTTANVDKMAKTIENLQDNVGGVGNSLGAIMEGMFAANICPKFDVFGHTFSKVSNDLKYYENGKLYCEVDAFLENGDYVMAIEVKAQCEMRDINKHIERLEKIRKYMDERNDSRKILGGIAAGFISERLQQNAEEKGLYVMVPTGDSVKIIENPDNFKEGVW
jgi:phage-related tail protein